MADNAPLKKNLQPVLSNSLLIAYNFDVMRTELYI
jgi:hypothetical protein